MLLSWATASPITSFADFQAAISLLNHLHFNPERSLIGVRRRVGKLQRKASRRAVTPAVLLSQ